MMMTLRELCEEVGVSRRAIQGYEEMGLIERSGTNKMGHVIFAEEAQKRVKKIKFYQELGFARNEILKLIDAPVGEVIFALKRRIEKLEEDKSKVEKAIKMAKEEIDRLLERGGELS